MSAPLRTVVHTRCRRRGRQELPTPTAANGDIDRYPTTPGIPDRSALAVLSLVAPVLVWTWFGITEYPELRVGIPVLIVVGIVALLLTRRLNLGRTFDLGGTVLIGLSAKFVFVVLRFDSIYGTYEGEGDAEAYHENGARLAEAYRNLDFSAPADQKVPGTGFIRIVTGYIYAIFTDRIAIGFIVYALFALIGCYLLFRAFEIGVPEGKHHRFALLIFLWPSMLFWPGSIGKEAWMILGIGLFTYGVARILSNRGGGLPLVAVGTWAIVMVRPHVILLLFGAFAIGYALRPGSRFGGMSLATKTIGLGLLFFAGTFILAASNDFFEIEELNSESLEQELNETADQTGQGGSSFDAPDPFSPIGYPLALVTVLFRPFPFEADNAQMLVTAVEGLVLAGLMALAAPQLLRAPALLRRWPLVAASIAYILVFAFAFASIANFGILARQRVQMLPFLFMLLSLPTRSLLASTGRRR